MAGPVANFVLENANAPGTNLNVVLAGAPIDRIPWGQVYSDGSQVFYFMDDGSQAEWGVGTFRSGPPTFISRDTVVGNTGGNTNKLNFTGSVQIYSEIPAERMPYINNNVIFAPGSLLDPHAGGVPVGATLDYYGTVAPSGWVWCNGQALSRTTYALLFAFLGTTYGAGNGTSTFNVPQRCEQFSVGRAFMGGAAGIGRAASIPNIQTLGAWVGDDDPQAHTHVLNWIDPGHSHGVSDPGHNHQVFDPGHNHAYTRTDVISGGSGAGGAGFQFQLNSVGTTNNASNISLGGSGTGIGIFGSFTGISASIASAGAGSGQNFPSAIVCNVIMYAGPTP